MSFGKAVVATVQGAVGSDEYLADNAPRNIVVREILGILVQSSEGPLRIQQAGYDVGQERFVLIDANLSGPPSAWPVQVGDNITLPQTKTFPGGTFTVYRTAPYPPFHVEAYIDVFAP